MTAAATCVASASPHGTPVASVRTLDGDQVDVALRDVGEPVLTDAVPWRIPLWFPGQRHFPGRYWTATVHDLVTYESLLEKCRLILADFDPTITHIVAQPFRLTAEVDGVLRRHVPDYALFRDTEMIISNVKPEERQRDPRVATALGWAREVVEDAGFEFEVFGEPDEAMMANVRFFAGYRHGERISPIALAEMRSRNLDGTTFGEAVARSHSLPARARAAVLHMLWRRELTIDLSCPLTAKTTMWELK